MKALKLFAKRSYVFCVHALGRGLQRIGVMGWLDKRTDRRGFHWLRSLFAIYDVDAMIALDVPWWTYDAIDAVDRYLAEHPGARVFEFGSGASTIWLARRAGTVHSVEHDARWFDLMRSRVAAHDHVTLTHVAADAAPAGDPLFHAEKEGYAGQSFEAYARSIQGTGQTYDVIVIDGRARVACLAMAQKMLAPGGMIVFDNTKRARYDRAIRASGLQASPLPGRTPSLPYADKTTLLHQPSLRDAAA